MRSGLKEFSGKRLRRPALGRHRNALQSAQRRRVCGKPAAAIPGRHDLELFERDHEHPVGYCPQPGRRRPLLRMAPSSAVRTARDAQRDHGTGSVGDVCLLVLHARDRQGLGALRPAVPAGRNLEWAAYPSGGVGELLDDTDAAVAGRHLRRSLVAGAARRTRRRKSCGGADSPRRILCVSSVTRGRSSRSFRHGTPSSCASGCRSTSMRGTTSASSPICWMRFEARRVRL